MWKDDFGHHEAVSSRHAQREHEHTTEDSSHREPPTKGKPGLSALALPALAILRDLLD